jgi:hypothetical protein
MPPALVTLEDLAALVRRTGGLVAGLVDGVAQEARAGTPGHDALKARQLRGRLLDLHAEVTRFEMLVKGSVRRSLADYLRAWAEAGRLHSRSDLTPPTGTTAVERARVAHRSGGRPVPTGADHDARLDAAWTPARQAMAEAGGAASAMLKEMQTARDDAILDASRAALIRSFQDGLAIYADLATLPPPVTKAEIGRLAEVAEAYEALIRTLEAAAARLAALLRDAA